MRRGDPPAQSYDCRPAHAEYKGHLSAAATAVVVAAAAASSMLPSLEWRSRRTRLAIADWCIWSSLLACRVFTLAAVRIRRPCSSRRVAGHSLGPGSGSFSNSSSQGTLVCDHVVRNGWRRDEHLLALHRRSTFAQGPRLPESSGRRWSRPSSLFKRASRMCLDSTTKRHNPKEILSVQWLTTCSLRPSPRHSLPPHKLFVKPRYFLFAGKFLPPLGCDLIAFWNKEKEITSWRIMVCLKCSHHDLSLTSSL